VDQPLVVAVDRDGEGALGGGLPDDVLVEEFLDLARAGDIAQDARRAGGDAAALLRKMFWQRSTHLEQM
jgi:hypothetical protein